MQNLIRFIRMYNFLLLFLIFQSIFVIIRNNSYQNYRIIKKTSEYTGFIYSISQNIKDYFQLKEVNTYLANENAKLLTLINSVESKTIINEKKEFDFISSQVINNTVSKRNNFITLNKGSHGIKQGNGINNIEWSCGNRSFCF